MSASAHFVILPAPTLSGAIPCFRLADGVPAASPPRRALWDAECTAILTRCAERCSNAEAADLIAATTGKRFKPDTVSERRAALGLGSPRHNDWTTPLRRWKPWQGAS